MTRVAVIGHVEFVKFVRLASFPARGAVTRADDSFTRAGGGGVVAAVVLAEHGAEVDFYCALGRDANGEAAAAELQARGVTLHVAWREQPTREVITLLERDGERAIITIGERLEPTAADPLDMGAAPRCGGRVLHRRRHGRGQARARDAGLVCSPRAREGLEEESVKVDALVFSAGDSDERDWAQRLRERTRLMVQTEGAHGGRWWGESEGRWEAAPAPGRKVDDYGCGDSFAAGLMYGLAQGLAMAQAARVGAEWGAEALAVAGTP